MSNPLRPDYFNGAWDPDWPCRGCGAPIGDREAAMITSRGLYHRLVWPTDARFVDPDRAHVPKDGCLPSDDERAAWDAFEAGFGDGS